MEEKRSRKAFAGKQSKRLAVLAILCLGIFVLAKHSMSGTAAQRERDTIGAAMLRSLSDEAESLLYSQFMPSMAFLSESGQGTHWLLQEGMDCLVPLYGYLTGHMPPEGEEAAADIRTILLAEAREGSLQEEPPEEAAHEDDIQEELADLLKAENEAALRLWEPSPFQRHAKQIQLELEPLEDYETLIGQFYTIDSNTMAGSDQLDLHRLMEADMTLSREGEGPQILIYHTHSQEAFLDSTPGDSSETIMGVGERLTTILTEEYGYRVLHHLGQYDIDSRDDSYSVALSELEQILKEYPSIQVVIDLHRDEMPEGIHLAIDLDGRPTARFMFFNGLSRTKKTGNIAYLYNENLDGNLAFSFQMQKAAAEYYPGLTRKIYLKGYRYNMHLRPRCLLIELGAQNNTLEEAMNACDPLAHILDLVLSGSA